MDKVTLKKKVAFRVMSILVSVIILIIVGELVSRLKLYFTSKDTFFLFAPFKKSLTPKVNYRMPIDEFISGEDTYYFKMKPGKFLPPEPYNYGYFTINSLGFRGKEFDPYNKNNRTRIFCVGESSTFCAESSDGETWPAKLGYYLDENARTKNRFEVINSGFPAAASTTYKNLIRLELIKYMPDIIIIYAGANDMILDRNIVKKKANRCVEFIHEKVLYYKLSMLYTLIIEKISYLMQKSPAPIILYDSNPVDVFADNIESVINVCREHAIRLIFVRQLYYSCMELFLSDNVSLDEITGILGKSNDGGWITPGKIETFNKIMKRMADASAKYGLEMMDFRNEFYKRLLDNEKLYYDYIHLTPRGNDLLASLMYRRILADFKE